MTTEDSKQVEMPQMSISDERLRAIIRDDDYRVYMARELLFLRAKYKIALDYAVLHHDSQFQAELEKGRRGAS